MVAVALCFGTVAGLGAAPAYHVLAPVPATAPVLLPKGKRVPAGWPAFAVGADPVVLRLAAGGGAGAADGGAAGSGPARLRVTTALDDREPRRVEVALAGPGGARLGELDLRFAHAIETFELEVPDAAEVARRGVTLRLLGSGAPLWFFGGASGGGGAGGDRTAAATGAQAAAPALPVEFQPHVLGVPAGTDRLAEFRVRVGSLASLQTFGWMEGCVLDGLFDLAQRIPAGPYAAARDAHWRIFLPDGRRLIYENPRSEPADDRVYGIEGGLPFADLARRDPRHPFVERFIAFARTRTRADGAIQDGNTLSAEGTYTIGHPLAVMAAVRWEPALADLARTQLRLRAERLWGDGALWLRRMDDNRRTFRGWARGVAWHALGVSRSIEPLRVHGATTAEEAELRRIAAWVLPLQRTDGLWACFLEERERGRPDTSGSAGIATALALGARLGVLGPDAGAAARRTLTGLEAHLTPDGLLGGAAQSNRGGEDLQRSDYRVLSQMGMGLMAQLLAEVGGQ